MRSRVSLVVALCAAGLGLVAGPSPVTAGCVGPSLEVPGAQTRFAEELEGRSVTVLPRRDGPLVVTGMTFANGPCNDTPNTSGCGAPETPAPSVPAKDVELTLRQGERTWRLGTADASGSEDNYAVRWDTELPAEVRPGRATLIAGTADLAIEVPAD